MISKAEIFSKLTDDYQNLIALDVTSTYLNPYQYLILRQRREIIRYVDYFYFDGVFLPYVLRVLTKRKFRAIPPDMSGFFKDLFRKIEVEHSTVYFIGSNQKTVSMFINIIQAQYPKMKIVGFRSGFFNGVEEVNDVVSKVITLNADYVILGMGSPHQEEFLVLLRKRGYKGCILTCGGFFHQTTKSIHYYPVLFKKLNLRWLYRIIDEPKLVKRYLFKYPVGVFKFVSDLYQTSHGDLFRR